MGVSQSETMGRCQSGKGRKAAKCRQKKTEVCSSKRPPKIGTQKCSTKRGARGPFNVEIALSDRELVKTCELFFPLRAREATGAEIRGKCGKITKFPSPFRPENGENCPKKGATLLQKYNFYNFSAPVSGVGPGRGICNFSGISAPEAFRAL